MSSIDGQPHPRAKQYHLRLLECVPSVHIVTIQEVWNDFLLLGVQLKGCPNVFTIHLYHWPSGRLIHVRLFRLRITLIVNRTNSS